MRALEGHIKYLITSAGGTIRRFFNYFNVNNNGEYIFTGTITDVAKSPPLKNATTIIRLKEIPFFILEIF